MQNGIRALLVHDCLETMAYFRHALEALQIETETAGTCREAGSILGNAPPPHLVFTGERLADGSWQDVILLAAISSAPINVIVVSDVVDIPFYLDAIQGGAFDFIVPPMSFSDFSYVVESAAGNALRRRAFRPRQAPSLHAVEAATPDLLAQSA